MPSTSKPATTGATIFNNPLKIGVGGRLPAGADSSGHVDGSYHRSFFKSASPREEAWWDCPAAVEEMSTPARLACTCPLTSVSGGPWWGRRECRRWQWTTCRPQRGPRSGQRLRLAVMTWWCNYVLPTLRCTRNNRKGPHHTIPCIGRHFCTVLFPSCKDLAVDNLCHKNLQNIHNCSHRQCCCSFHSDKD